MTNDFDDRLLPFIEGNLDPDELADLLDHLDSDPELSRAARDAFRGRALIEEDAMRVGTPRSTKAPTRRVPGWWVAAAAVITLAVTWPLARATGVQPSFTPSPNAVLGPPTSPDPSFVVVLQGVWEDADVIDAAEARRRGGEYWQWAVDLRERELLIAAGDLMWEPGRRIQAGGAIQTVAQSSVEDENFLVGMFALRVSSYEEALEIARECPHLRYGGDVSIRQVAAGFVTAGWAGDWSP